MSQPISPKVYRFKFSDHVIDEIMYFSKLHRYDTRIDYKKAWEKWSVEHSDIVQRETNRMESIGFQGNVLDKMYKAGRYYFCKKKEKKKEEKIHKRKYIIMDINVLTSMDQHIRASLNDPTFTPANGYDWFCNQHKDILFDEIVRILNEGYMVDVKQLTSKIKKTYKNRYFLITHIE